MNRKTTTPTQINLGMKINLQLLDLGLKTTFA